MNKEIINQLTLFAYYYSILGDVYRERAYKLAISSIKELNVEINLEYIKNHKIKNINKIKEKIIEWLNTKEIKELNVLKNSKVVKAYSIFNKIMGVGPQHIKNWIDNKIYNLDDLKKAEKIGKISLTRIQSLGLKYYNDLNERIPRKEIEEIYNILKIPNSIILGSYRRESETSGDIDILTTTKIEHLNINNAVILIKGAVRMSFIMKHAGKMRQVDILYSPKENYYFALLYFTGSWEFNEYMRSVAKSMGYKLNQVGLFDGNKMINVSSEGDIFDILNIKYIEPKYR